MSYDGPRISRLTPAIKHLLILNAAIFGLNLLLMGRLSAPSGGGSMGDAAPGGFWFAFSWGLGLEGYGLGFLRLLTYQFTHSFTDAWHFLGNMMVLFFMGTLAEPRLGYRGTIKLYLVGGVAGAVLHLCLAAVQGYANVPLVGASGACYAFTVYAACRHPNALVFNIVPLWILAAVLVFVAFYQTFVEFAGGFGSGVSHSAHLGGASIGFLAFKANWFIDWQDHAGHVRPSWWGTQMQRIQARRAEREQHHAQAQQQQLDDILAKVKSDGLASLSSSERSFLERVSRQSSKQ